MRLVSGSSARGVLCECDQCRIPLVYFPGETLICSCGRGVFPVVLCAECEEPERECECPCDECGEPMNHCSCPLWEVSYV